jgi:hypothetical protein
MKDRINQLLSMILPEDQHDIWLNSFNYYFNMSPQEAIDGGDKDKVISYLRFHVYGPY